MLLLPVTMENVLLKNDGNIIKIKQHTHGLSDEEVKQKKLFLNNLFLTDQYSKEHQLVDFLLTREMLHRKFI
jgi:hypothetical protein